MHARIICPADFIPGIKPCMLGGTGKINSISLTPADLDLGWGGGRWRERGHQSCTELSSACMTAATALTPTAAEKKQRRRANEKPPEPSSLLGALDMNS